ncbi:MAG: hypothetical protein ABIG30_01745 [Candidatus Aenigmatarchaeota archaeon]
MITYLARHFWDPNFSWEEDLKQTKEDFKKIGTDLYYATVFTLLGCAFKLAIDTYALGLQIEYGSGDNFSLTASRIHKSDMRRIRLERYFEQIAKQLESRLEREGLGDLTDQEIKETVQRLNESGLE